MQIRKCKKNFSYCLLLVVITGCVKQTSYYYADKEKPGIAIFSNSGNNVLSCLIDGKPWRSITRSVGGSLFYHAVYEVYIERQITNSLQDTISIVWTGYYTSNQYSQQLLGLVLPVAKNFKLSDLYAMQDKRIIIDSSNGFFFADISSVSGTAAAKGKGTIYFNRAVFDSVGNNFYAGRIAGLFEAQFGSIKISDGRFDDNISSDQFR